MVKQVQVYEASDGTLHRTYTDALKTDLWIALLGFGVLNEASSKQLVDKIMGEMQNVRTLHDIL